MEELPGILTSGAAIALAVVFLAAGASKLRNLGEFTVALQSYEVVPLPLAPLFAIALVVLELAAGIMWLGWPVLGSPAVPILLSLVLLASFTWAIVTNIRRGRSLACGCGGLFPSDEVGWSTVGRNATLTLIVLMPGAFEVMRSSGWSDLAFMPLNLQSIIAAGVAASAFLFAVLAVDAVVALELAAKERAADPTRSWSRSLRRN